VTDEFSRNETSSEIDPFCPYVGLAPFKEAHKDYYFGRTDDALNLADNALYAPITVLYGASGVGKTSLLNVGLPKALKDLKQDALIVGFRSWQVDSLEEAISKEILNAIPEDIKLSESKKDFFNILRTLAKQLPIPIVLILDQFEEYFVYHAGRATRRFEESLDELTGDPELGIHLIISIREDRYHLLDQLRISIPDILENTLLIEHLDDDATSEAIIKPVEKYNSIYRENQQSIKVQEDFVTRLLVELKQIEIGTSMGGIGDVEQRKVELPYLQLALEKIWETTIDGNTHELNKEIFKERSVRRIVIDHLTQEMSEFDEEEQDLCARMFDRMVTPTGAKIALCARDLAEYPEIKADESHLEQVLERLAKGKRRLITPVSQPGSVPAYEIFHDVLGHPILRWKESYLSDKRAKEERRQAEEKAREERRRAEEKAEEERRRLKKEAEAERRRVERRAEEERKRANQRATWAFFLGIFAILMMFFAAFSLHLYISAKEAEKDALEAKETAVKAERNAKEKQARLMGVLSKQELQKGNAMIAMFLALKALPRDSKDTETPYTAIAEAALWNSLKRNREKKYLDEHHDDVHIVAFSSDGELLATSSKDKTVRLWNTQSGKEIQVFDGHAAPVIRVRFSPDGRRVASTSEDNKLLLWDVETLKVLANIELGIEEGFFFPSCLALTAAF